MNQITSFPDSCLLVLATYNEELRISQTLEYYTKLGKLIHIIDNQSEDKTIEIASHFNVNILSHSNSGTTESPEWFSWLLNELPSQYYLFLSCSEKISYEALSSIESMISNNIDLCYWRRISFTQHQQSLIFNSFYDLLTFQDRGHFTCRFASAKSLSDNIINVKIHDNFRLFRHKCSFIEVSDSSHCIRHYRPITDFKVLQKLLYYAQEESYANSSSRKDNFKLAFFHLIKCIRELLYLAILLFTFRLTQVRANELIARIVLHLQIYILVTSKSIV